VPGGIDDLIQSVRDALGQHTARLIGGELSVAQWQRECENELRRNIYASYTMGLGRMPTREEEREIQRMLNGQMAYLRGFAEDYRAGRISDEQALVRIGMYADRLRGFEEQGLIDGLGVDLPQVPGDCGTRCLTNCKCHLEFEEDERRRGRGYEAVLNVYWVLGDAEHCDDCVKLSQKWNPKVVRPGAGR